MLQMHGISTDPRMALDEKLVGKYLMGMEIIDKQNKNKYIYIYITDP